MPNVPHEAVVEVLRNEPGLVAVLLARFGVRLPSGAVPVIADSNLSSRDPRLKKTLLADNVIVLQGLKRKVAVVVEVQTNPPGRSRSLAWPAYAACARAILACDTVLMVIGLSAETARRSAKLIRTGHRGFDLAPYATGPGLLPKPGGIAYGPELTVLSVMTGDLDLTSHEGRMMALTSIAPASQDRRERYTRFIRAVVPESARAALEELLSIIIPDPFIDGFIAKGEAQMLLRYLNTRFVVPEDIRKRVTDCPDTTQIESWFDRALTGADLDEIFKD